MNCQSVRQRLPAYVNGPSRSQDREALRRHLLACETCHQEYEYLARLNSPLRELPRVDPPPALATVIRLRVAAASGPSFWQRWQVHLANLMRPVALPAAGGLLAALVLFGMLIPGVGALRVESERDIRAGWVTEAKVKTTSIIPFHGDLLEEDDLLVEAWVNERGSIANFEVVGSTAGSAARDGDLRQQLSNVMFTTVFEPATEFGQPAPGKMFLSFRKISRITIRG